jgi:hypothetical protein
MEPETRLILGRILADVMVGNALLNETNYGSGVPSCVLVRFVTGPHHVVSQVPVLTRLLRAKYQPHGRTVEEATIRQVARNHYQGLLLWPASPLYYFFVPIVRLNLDPDPGTLLLWQPSIDLVAHAFQVHLVVHLVLLELDHEP